MKNSPTQAEDRAMTEYWDLMKAPVYWGTGVPRGNGRLVLVLPGLFGNDWHLQPLNNWLSRVGYRPAVSMLPVNAGCPKRLVEQIEKAFEMQTAGYEGDVAIIGYSRGGLLGKGLMNRIGKRCTHFIALGSPLGGVLRRGRSAMQAAPGGAPSGNETVHNLMRAGQKAIKLLDPDCNMPACDCDYMDDLFATIPGTTKLTAIFSGDDPIVAPGAARIEGATNIEISGSHSGLVFNREVFPYLATALQ